MKNVHIVPFLNRVILKCRRDARKIYIISKIKKGNNPFKNGLIKLTYRHADRHMVTSGMQSFEEFLFNMYVNIV
jgi:hypothetical protein